MNCPTDNSVLRRGLRGAIAGLAVAIAGGAIVAPARLHACDCGCETGACDSLSCDSGSCDCETGASRSVRLGFDMRKTPVYKTLDLLAGGIERVLHLDEDSDIGCDEGGESCDDACDAAMIMELSAPLPSPAPQPIHRHVQPTSPAIPAPAPADRIIAPNSIQPSMPRVPAPIMPAPIDSEPLQFSQPRTSASGLVPAPIESAAPNAPRTELAPAELPDPRQAPAGDSSEPRLPAPILDRERNALPNGGDIIEPGLDESTDPFLDDPFQSTPLGRQTMGSGLRPVQYQRGQSRSLQRLSTERSSDRYSRPAATQRKISRSPKSSRRGMLR